MATQMSCAEYRYNTEYDEYEDSPTTVGNSKVNDDAEFTIRIDKVQPDPDLSTDRNSDYDDNYTHTNNIQPQQAHSPYQKQHQYPPNHYGYDLQQKEKETQKTAEETHVDHSDIRENGSSIANISEAILVPLPYLPLPSPVGTEEILQQERQHHRSIITTDSAVSLTGDDILASPCSTNLQSHSNTISSTSSSSISPCSRETKSGSGSSSAGPRSISLGATPIKGCDIPVPPLPPQQLQHQQRTTPCEGGIIANINAQPSPADIISSNPPSPGKTGWERETPTTPTPQLHKGHSSHQHSSSLFDYFRTRKQSISKNSAHHAATAAATNTSSATFPTPPLPANLPLMGAPPTIAKSRIGLPHQYSFYAPVPPPLRKQSLDISALSGYQSSSSSTFGSPLTKHDRHAATIPTLPTTVMTPSSSTSSIASPHFQYPHTSFPCVAPSHHPSRASSAHSTLSKVAAAVVGATMGKRRGSVTAEVLELGQGPNGHVKAYEPSSPSLIRQGLCPAQLNDHARFLKEAKTTQELTEYIDKLYYTVLNESVALEHANKQVSALQKELDQSRSRAEEDRKGLIAEADRVKGQIATMEENFLLWRAKVHNDQMVQQEDYLNERLIRQDRIEELKDDLNMSQDEAARLRRRLLVLEYEDGYVGPTSLLNDDPSASKVPESGPMTVATHKRRSADFKILETKALNYEHQLQDLTRALETERQEHQKDLIEFRMQMHAKVIKLEEEVQAAKMEASIYTEMMHEIVAENDNLRTKVKQAQRKSRVYGGGSSTSFGSSNKSVQDYYSYPGFDSGGDSMCSSDDEMEEITISHLEKIGTQPNDLGDSDHDDFEDIHDEDDDQPDPVFVARILRQMGATWATSAQYATHRLLVSTDNNAAGYHLEFPGISQFLIPASAVFRDFLAIDHDPGHITGQVPSIAPSIGEEAPLPLPVLELAIPYPEHFQSLLRVMYDLEIEPWASTFTPATIGPITANVARLECSTDITLRCLEYYQQIRSSQASDAMHSKSVQGDREDLERLYQLAAMNGLLSKNT
ncbi:hypothetical protein BGZ81_007258 [Podila clonocystis]|nr:hypothetical protein BGZ81_007258 [Podila clonocystis]